MNPIPPSNSSARQDATPESNPLWQFERPLRDYFEHRVRDELARNPNPARTGLLLAMQQRIGNHPSSRSIHASSQSPWQRMRHWYAAWQPFEPASRPAWAAAALTAIVATVGMNTIQYQPTDSVIQAPKSISTPMDGVQDKTVLTNAVRMQPADEALQRTAAHALAKRLQAMGVDAHVWRDAVGFRVEGAVAPQALPHVQERLASLGIGWAGGDRLVVMYPVSAQ